MSDVPFVHLHVHSQYSMLDSAVRLGELVAQTKKLGMSAVALTDHANMFGTVQFYKLCEKAEIGPILGCELNLCQEGSAQRGHGGHEGHHLVLLARSQSGYRNLVRLVSLGWIEATSPGVPSVDFELLYRHREGLLGLSACMGGYVAQQILHRGEQAGAQALARLRDCFEPDAFYVELQDHGFAEQKVLNQILVGLAGQLQLPLVATNDCHFLERRHARAQMILQCVAAGCTLEEMERGHHNSEEMYLKSGNEMAALFAEIPEAMENTLRIAEMCAGAATPLAETALPRFPVPDGEGLDEEQYFRKLARRGLHERFEQFAAMGKQVDTEAYSERLQMECDVICEMGYAGYFLIVHDFIDWAKRRGIPVGPGRGSGAGSLVAYAMRITDLDPIPYGLLFERFLNPERVSMPDFDIDFCMDRRDEVIQYVRDKYGSQSVGQIATFHLLKSRSVVRDVARVMKMTPQEGGRIATLVPEPVQGKSVSVDQALKQEPRLKSMYEKNSQVADLLDNAMSLENLTRHAGMHAAGVVISQGPLWEQVPVFCPEPGLYVTQYPKDDVEAAGLIKFDFLGLKTLTVIDLATRLINKRPDGGQTPLRMDHIPLDDKATFALMQSGETTNVFQLESSGMQALMKRLKPDCFEDVVALVALYRPGPLGSGMVEDFVVGKRGKAVIKYPHPCLEGTLKETFGVMVYQEQVMEAARQMAGFSLGAADLLRRAMGKKKPEAMAMQKVSFVNGALKNGHTTQEANYVFDLMDNFAGYGFNKSHSAAYALIAYQCAYLKAHYPVEFLCAAMTADKDRTEKVVRTVAEARAMGITVLPPDVNESEIDFTVVYSPEASGPDGRKTIKARKDRPVASGGKVRDPANPRVRFGLGAVKGVGTAALDAIFEARSGAVQDEGKQPFTDLFDFTSRVDLRRVNKAVIEALVQCGAMDGMHKPIGVGRHQALAAIDVAIDSGKKVAADRQSGQTDLFGLLSAEEGRGPSRAPALAFDQRAEPWDRHELLRREKNALGFYISGHPLDDYRAELRRFCSATTASLSATADEGATVVLGGVIQEYRERTTKSGERMGFFALEDPLGRVEVIVRSQEGLKACRELVERDIPVWVSGNVRFDRDRGQAAQGEDQMVETAPAAKLVLTEMVPLYEALRKLTKSVCVSVHVDRLDRSKLEALRQLLEKHPGPCPVTIELASSDGWAVTLGTRGLHVEPSQAMLSSLEHLFGEKVCELR